MLYWLSVRNVKAVSLSLLLFIYPVMALSAASIRYTETVHRITIQRVFNETLFGSSLADSLAALGLLLLFLSITFRSNSIKLASIVIFVAGIISLFANIEYLTIVGLATLPLLLASLLCSKLISNRILKRTASGKILVSTFTQLDVDLNRVVRGFLIIIIILEIGALARWMSYPAIPTEIYDNEDLFWRVARLESALFQSLNLLSPILVTLIGFSFLYRWYVFDLINRLSKFVQGHEESITLRNRVKEASKTKSENKIFNTSYQPQGRSISPRVGMGAKSTHSIPTVVADHVSKKINLSSLTRTVPYQAVLSASLIISSLIVIYPHLPGVNPQGSGVSTDEQYYMNWIGKIGTQNGGERTANLPSIIFDSFMVNKGDRPLTLLVILAISNSVGLPIITVIRYLPVVLAPMLVFANYLFIRHALKMNEAKEIDGQQNKIKIYASIIALFASLSPQIVVGEYAGLLANWLALIPALFAAYFLIKSWRSKNRYELGRNVLIFFGLTLLVMFIHLYTWEYLVAFTVLYCGLSFIFSRKQVSNPKFKIFIFLVIVGATFSVDYIRSISYEIPSAAGPGSAVVKNIQSVQGYDSIWKRLNFTLGTYVGGFLSNPVLFLLTLVWIIRADLARDVDRAILSMLFIIAIPILIGTVEFQTRILYNTAFQIPALLAIASTLNTDKRSANRTLLIIALLGVLGTYALRSVANLYLVTPEDYSLGTQFLLP